MNDINVIEVVLSGKSIGKLALTVDNLCAFEMVEVIYSLHLCLNFNF
jgi:hypothetical protein